MTSHINELYTAKNNTNKEKYQETVISFWTVFPKRFLQLFTTNSATVEMHTYIQGGPN